MHVCWCVNVCVCANVPGVCQCDVSLYESMFVCQCVNV